MGKARLGELCLPRDVLAAEGGALAVVVAAVAVVAVAAVVAVVAVVVAVVVVDTGWEVAGPVVSVGSVVRRGSTGACSGLWCGR